MARQLRLDVVELAVPLSLSQHGSLKVSTNAKVAYRKCTAYIADSVNNMGIQSAWPIDEKKWSRLACGLEGRRHDEACSMIQEAKNSGDRQKASDTETWLIVMHASTTLLRLATEIAACRNGFVISTKDIEGAWDALTVLSCRLPTCGTFLVVDELEPEIGEIGCDSDADGDGIDSQDEEYDDTNDGHLTDDDDEDGDGSDDVSYCSERADFQSREDGFVGSWSSDPALSDREESDEDEGVERESEEEETESNGASWQGLGSLTAETVSRLKVNLSARGLSSDGTHNDLVARLLDAVPLAAAESHDRNSPPPVTAASALVQPDVEEEARSTDDGISSDNCSVSASKRSGSSEDDGGSGDSARSKAEGATTADQALNQRPPKGKGRTRASGASKRKPLGDRNGEEDKQETMLKAGLGGSSSSGGISGASSSLVDDAKRLRRS